MKSRRTNWADLAAEPLTESGQAAYDDEARRTIPVDDAKVDESIITQDDWDRAKGAHERFKSLLETKPLARECFFAAQAVVLSDTLFSQSTNMER